MTNESNHEFKENAQTMGNPVYPFRGTRKPNITYTPMTEDEITLAKKRAGIQAKPQSTRPPSKYEV